ncbi:hypothetical protein JOF29_003515 [Kribbella aluminosa]|uniref:DUF4832 domain-containing protein n=1 Tax=Kribbella aluminosa TaxID=416017 RepID=A0ABS4UL92_9ACTN|nr:DUF4832 domain-containing protein [Kribbella aluminosa]MBP2352432.1 hypothetical protein [Kribbella aluminosa]
MRRLGTALAVTGLLLPAQAAMAHDAPNGTTVSYTTNDEVIANQERGFYHHAETHYYADNSGYVPLDVTKLRNFRTQEHITQILRLFYLEKFAKQDVIDKHYLDLMQADFDTARAAGVKLIVRFAYALPGDGWPPPTPYGDAPVSRVVKQIKQLTPILRANSDLIAVVQSGFVGLWGEGYYTDYFSNPADPSQVSDQNWADRKAVIDALLRALPKDRMVQVRTPYMKQRMYGVPTGTAGGLTAKQAYDGSAVARIGQHNDCFLASPDDFGTYLSDPIELDKDFVAQDTNYVPEGGETCGLDAPRSEWPSAAAEMARLHFSFLNIEYHPDVLASWGSNIEIAKQKLGYRFALTQSTVSSQHGTVKVDLKLRNDGWAAPYNPRQVQLIFQNSKHTYKVDVPADPRRWSAGAVTSLNWTVKAPPAPGKYRVLLNVADPKLQSQSRLPGSAETYNAVYALRFANNGTWQPTTGYNDLQQTVTTG